MPNANQALLNPTDFNQLALCVEAIGTQDFPKVICEYCAAVCRADKVFLNAVFDGHKPAPLFSNHIAERQREALGLYLDVAYLLDPFVLLIREKQGDAIVRLKSIAPDDFKRSEYYLKFYKEMGLADELLSALDASFVSGRKQRR